MISSEDNLFLEKIRDLAYQSERHNVFSRFLTEREQSLAISALASQFCSYSFYGGHERATRKVLALSTFSANNTDVEFPVTSLTVIFDRFYTGNKISHRDFLGTLMGLQLSRDTIGDIIIGDRHGVIFALSNISGCICAEVNRIGRMPVKISLGLPLGIPEQKFLEKDIVIPSGRVDAVISGVYNISREKSAALINSDCVFVNGLLCEKSGKVLTEGDIISVRGYGKFIFEKTGSFTKKSNMHVTIKLYL